MAENFGIQGRGSFYDQTGTIRDVVQNHILQILANLTMEPPAGIDSESVRDEKAKVLKEIKPIKPENVIRGQFVGYRNEPGVAADSKVETFAALKLSIDSWRWHGVPFFIRAGKTAVTSWRFWSASDSRRRLARPPPTNYGLSHQPDINRRCHGKLAGKMAGGRPWHLSSHCKGGNGGVRAR